MIQVIGIGSPFGDDRLGWVAAEALRKTLGRRAPDSARIAVSTCDHPGGLPIAQWRTSDRVVLIDAVRTGAAPGTLHRLDGGRLHAGEAVLSSHGFGVAAALELARALDSLPRRLTLFGIEMDADHAGPDLSRAVQAALPQLLGEVERELSAPDERDCAKIRP